MVQQGPSSELISRIHHLAELLKNLPTVLPLNPPSSRYGFGLDTEKLGPNGTIVFRERGKQCEALIQMFIRDEIEIRTGIIHGLVVLSFRIFSGSKGPLMLQLQTLHNFVSMMYSEVTGTDWLQQETMRIYGH